MRKLAFAAALGLSQVASQAFGGPFTQPVSRIPVHLGPITGDPAVHGRVGGRAPPKSQCGHHFE